MPWWGWEVLPRGRGLGEKSKKMRWADREDYTSLSTGRKGLQKRINWERIRSNKK